MSTDAWQTEWSFVLPSICPLRKKYTLLSPTLEYLAVLPEKNSAARVLLPPSPPERTASSAPDSSRAISSSPILPVKFSLEAYVLCEGALAFIAHHFVEIKLAGDDLVQQVVLVVSVLGYLEQHSVPLNVYPAVADGAPVNSLAAAENRRSRAAAADTAGAHLVVYC